MSNYIEQLNWRYATKRMNNTPIAEDKLARIVDAIHLAPTSLGLQPFNLLVIKDAETRARKEAELLRQREVEELSAKELLLKREDEFNHRINQVEEEWGQKFSELEKQRQAQDAMLEKERQMQQLESYRQRRIQAEQESIIPELIDLVTGNSEEDIENSIKVLRERSSAIIEAIQRTSQPARPRGSQVTAPPTGPMDNQQEYQTLSAEDIRNMPMDQYVKMRDRLLQARSPRGRF